jgi:probable F420-dependent oxidoreductase
VPSVEGVRGHVYGKPVATMRAYLEAMAASPYGAPEPPEKPLTVLAALGPRMLALSASHADGAHPYNITPEHTRQARQIMGPGKLLCPEVWVLLETDAAKARALGRQALANYLRLDNYVNNWRRIGFSDDDLSAGGSDRFVDANILWGDETTIRARLQEQWDAGADHVCIQSISPDGGRKPDEKVLALLAPG